jgi:hypothetical protein
MTKDEALKLALEAFGEIDWSNNSQWQSDRAKVAIASLKEALAQPEQEPTTKAGELLAMKTELWKQPEQDWECKHCTDGCPACDARKLPEQEPVAFVKGWNCGRLEVIVRSLNQRFEIDQPLYTTPPQRTWVGLTDEEIRLQWSEFWEAECHPWAIDFAQAIEAKLRSKNS